MRGREDLGVADEDVAEGPAAGALLVEAGNGSHGDAFDDQGLAVWQFRLLRHHAAHVADVPGQPGGPDFRQSFRRFTARKTYTAIAIIKKIILWLLNCFNILSKRHANYQSFFLRGTSRKL